LFDRLRSWNKYDGNQNIKRSVEKTTAEFSKLRKQIELIGIEVKGLDEKAETGRLELKTKFINQHFINELDKIGLQFINIRGTWLCSLVVLLEQRNLNLTSVQ
jgi:2,3-bisphosphoglycerate-independent phosphoglycerate mutase